MLIEMDTGKKISLGSFQRRIRILSGTGLEVVLYFNKESGCFLSAFSQSE